MPVTEIPTDLLTPLGAYLTLRESAGGSFLLESVERGRLGRYSFVGAGSRLVSLRGGRDARRAGRRLPRLRRDRRVRADRAAAGGRAGRTGEPASSSPTSCSASTTRAASPSCCAATQPGSTGASPPLPRGSTPRGPLEREPSRDEHLRRVERAQEHIREGDVFQVVIAQRATRPTSASAVELYRALRRVNPSPYLFLLELGDVALVGSSPETVVKCAGRRAELNPIAGTISPGEGDAAALLSSEKDRAEHTMLVDLGRNDLSRVCVPGSVRVERFMEPERYSHVTHLVSEVVGELRDGITPFELLRATFPAGTVSGAPKVRAMQIISELEQYRRGIYAGAVGYFLPDSAELDTCIAIRTLWLRDGVAHLQAGGGIVADSDPAAEHEECLAKLRALEAAIELAESEQDAAP